MVNEEEEMGDQEGTFKDIRIYDVSPRGRPLPLRLTATASDGHH